MKVIYTAKPPRYRVQTKENGCGSWMDFGSGYSDPQDAIETAQLMKHQWPRDEFQVIDLEAEDD